MRPDPRGIRVPPCGGVVQPGDTREDLIARGFTAADADEVVAFMAKLDGKEATQDDVESEVGDV